MKETVVEIVVWGDRRADADDDDDHDDDEDDDDDHHDLRCSWPSNYCNQQKVLHRASPEYGPGASSLEKKCLALGVNTSCLSIPSSFPNLVDSTLFCVQAMESVYMM